MQALLYSDLVSWYRLLDPSDDHALDVEHYRECFARAGVKGGSLLELGAGAGNNAVHLKKHFQCTLTDLSEGMRELSRELNPECEHLAGDMRTLRLGRTFDAVLVHDAIVYMTTREDLRAAARTAFVHTRPGGVAIFEPDCVRETFKEQTEVEGEDEGERSLRCMMWSRDPDPGDETYVVDFAFLLREGEQVRAVHDRHVAGLFSRATWLEILSGVGYRVEVVSRQVEGYALDLFLCRKP